MGYAMTFYLPPKITHQVLVGQLFMILQTSCHSSGVILLAPMDVHLSVDNIVQPDLIYISNDNLSIMKNEKVMGAPDLLVEILSPSTGARDKVRKKELYARFGVQEYWIVDPVHSAVDQFVLIESGNRYALTASYDTTDQLVSNRFPCLAVKLDELFDSIARFRTED
jgi:Uma2 family endonuclease